MEKINLKIVEIVVSYMSDEWHVGIRRQSTVSDWRKLIEDFRDQFPYDPVTALIVETFANSLDAGATKIGIQVRNGIYEIEDNGKGMTQKEFIEYHNIASLTKKRGEGIGFAGVGAKTFIDRAKYVITETKSKEFHGASDWRFKGKSLEWKVINPPPRIKCATGTYVKIKMKNDSDLKKLRPAFVKQVIQTHYNAVLLGYYGAKTIYVNGEHVNAWQLKKEKIEKRKRFDFRFGGHNIKGFFIKSKRKIPEEFQGISIVVWGKTVTREWFKQYPLESEKFTGMVLADYLIDVIRTSKSDFDRTSMLWKKFHGKMGKVFLEWLDEIGARPKLPKSIPEDRLTRELEKSINDILKMPEFQDLANIVFQNLMKKYVGIKSNLGDRKGKITEGRQPTTGTIGKGEEGSGVDTIGPEAGEGITESEKGDEPIERVRRRVKGGIRIGYDDQPNEKSEGWIGIDPNTGQQAIIINTGHPSWKIAEGLSFQAKAEHVKVYHLLRTVVNTLAEEADIENPKEIAVEILKAWYNKYIGV